MEGYPEYRILWHFEPPLSCPVLGTVAIIHPIAIRNEFIEALMTMHKLLLPVGLLSNFPAAPSSWVVLNTGAYLLVMRSLHFRC